MGKVKTFTLGTKISLGLGALLIIALGLGGMAIWRMKEVQATSSVLLQEVVPEEGVNNSVQQAVLLTMFEMQGYGMSGEDRYLEAGRSHLGQIKQALDSARQLPQWGHDQALQNKVNKVAAKVLEYQTLLEATVAKNQALTGLRQSMAASADQYYKNSINFLQEQERAMTSDFSSGVSQDQLRQRQEKLSLINDVLELHSDIQVANWKAQATRDPQVAQAIMKNFGLMDHKLGKLRALVHREESRKQLTSIGEAGHRYHGSMMALLDEWKNLQKINKKRDGIGMEIISLSRSATADSRKAVDVLGGAAVKTLGASAEVMLVGLAVAMALGLALAFLITRSTTGPVKAVIAGLSGVADQVAASASQVNNASQALADGASQQAAALEETSSSLEEMSSMTQTNAENADHASTLTQESNGVVVTANQAMADLTKSMQEISQASEQTGKIIRTIDEIAFQTNLLALNAAVEAARAGEAGAGFAVVADEVRNLAMRAAEAAKNTAGLIEGTIQKIQEGSAMVSRTNEAFSAVAASSAKVVDLIGEIAAASAEQAQGIEQLNRAANEMDKVTQQNAASAEESAAASQELSSQAATMQGFAEKLIVLVGASQVGSPGKSGNGVPLLARDHPPAPKSSSLATSQSLPVPIGQSALSQNGEAEF